MNDSSKIIKTRVRKRAHAESIDNELDKKTKLSNEDSPKNVKSLKLPKTKTNRNEISDSSEIPKTSMKRKRVKAEDTDNKIEKIKLSNDDALKEPKRLKLSTAKKESFQTNNYYGPQWNEHELLAEQYSLGLNTASQIIKLFEEDNTIPFIARYRRNVTNGMGADELRAIKEGYNQITVLKNKIGTVMKNLEKVDVLTEGLKGAVSASRSIEELEYIYAPFKPGSKRTLAEKAKTLGLEEPALIFLHNKNKVNLYDFISENEELADIASVEKGIVHIIASVMATDTEILSSIRQVRKETNFIIKTKKTSSKDNASEDKRNLNNKFDNYDDFEIPVKYIKPHQVLAINRGENLKILAVKIDVPDSLFHSFKKVCLNKWMYIGDKCQERERIIFQAIQDSYTRLVKPLAKREVRSELKQKAESAACEVFNTNLKQLLLGTPLKGKAILGIDPGYTNGCKLALISPLGNLIANDVIYPHKHHKSTNNATKDILILKNMLLDYNCELIALGNGTACRQTEEWLTTLIQKNVFHPLDVKYTVIREEGASIYSCSQEAKKEFPSLDPNIISAVSLARRVQDPLAEFIKIEPKHLGIGMYQHDVKSKHLDESLRDVISECVSFVGVDLNTASQCLLRHVAGLSDKKAQSIINYRNENGAFVSRKQLLKVFGIGEKIFLQCAGFLRVGPTTNEEAVTFYNNSKASKLDRTNIHPESYNIAFQIIKKLNLKICDIGEPHLISAIKENMSQLRLPDIRKELNCNESTVHLILESLIKSLNHDFRNECPKDPVFKKGLTNINDIKAGMVVNGVVNNVTHFGCFVDIGVGINGLIHISKSNGLDLQIGNKIEARVLEVDINKKRIGLQALRVLA